MLPSELTNTIEQFVVYVHRNEAYFTYIYVYHTNVFEADNISKTLPQMSFHLYIFDIFISLRDSTHDSADSWSAHRSPAARDSFKRVQGWVASASPNKNAGYAGVFNIDVQSFPDLSLFSFTVLINIFNPFVSGNNAVLSA